MFRAIRCNDMKRKAKKSYDSSRSIASAALSETNVLARLGNDALAPLCEELNVVEDSVTFVGVTYGTLPRLDVWRKSTMYCFPSISAWTSTVSWRPPSVTEPV